MNWIQELFYRWFIKDHLVQLRVDLIRKIPKPSPQIDHSPLRQELKIVRDAVSLLQGSIVEPPAVDLSPIMEELAVLHSDIEQLRECFDSKTASVSGRVDTLDTTVATLGVGITALGDGTRAFDSIVERLRRDVEADVRSALDKIGHLSTDISELHSAVKSLGESHDNLSVCLDSVRASVPAPTVVEEPYVEELPVEEPSVEELYVEEEVEPVDESEPEELPAPVKVRARAPMKTASMGRRHGGFSY